MSTSPKLRSQIQTAGFLNIESSGLKVSASIALFLAVASRIVPWFRLILYSVTFGSIITFFVLTIICLMTVKRWKASDISQHPLKGFKPLAFTAPTKWKVELEEIRQDEAAVKTSILPSSFGISSSLDDFLGLIIRDFVDEWYGRISQDPAFSNQVDKTIRHALREILHRANNIDIVEVVVGKVVPIITTHLSDFSVAEKAVRGKHLNKNLTESEELDLAIAGKYREGRLHPAASLAYSDSKLAQQDHLRQLVVKILPLVMPLKEHKSRTVSIVTEELVSCAVLSPVLALLVDPDTWNQLMEVMGRSTLQDRKTVERLRAALDEHATPEKTARRLIFGRITPKDDERSYERFIRSIRICSNLSDVRRLRNEISSQIKRDSKIENQDQLYLRRLENAKRVLDQKVAYLSAGTGGYTSVSNNTLESSKSTTSGMEGAHLIDILRNSSGLSYFMEFMDRRKRIALVQFWMLVDGLRSPLEVDPEEDDETIPTQTSWTSSDRNDIAHIYESYFSIPELNISERSKLVVKTFLKAGRNAIPIQYLQARGAILRAQTTTYESMENEDLDRFKKSDLFYKYLASDDLISSVPKEPLPIIPPIVRTTSPIKKFHRSSSTINTNKLSVLQQDENIVTRHSLEEKRPKLFDDDWDIDPMSVSRQSLDRDKGLDASGLRSPANGVVEAMEAALNDIMGEPLNNEDDSRRLSMRNTSTDSGRLTLNDKSILFDSPRSSIDSASAPVSKTVTPTLSRNQTNSKGKPPTLAALGLVNTFAAKNVFAGEELFPDDAHDIAETEEEKTASENEDDIDNVHEAAPGDLGLAEAISDLNFSIDKLCTQETIIGSMLKKAELTNNTAELRILTKSKESLLREIRRKELQRQQYIVQESDNSLYGRASIRINRSMVGIEHGKEYGIYIIDVRRRSGEQMADAEWAVPRRYSEFFQLHQDLRARFASVKALEFPRRKMVLKLQKDFLDKRRIALELYLRSLLLLPDVCRSRELRAFLSQQSLPPVTAPHGDSVEDKKDFISKLYNSIADGMEGVIGNLPLLEQLSQQLSIAAINLGTNYPVPGSTQGVLKTTTVGGAELNVVEAEAELSAFENKENPPFVKPICDIFLEVFKLNKGSSWLRGRAVVVVLHQLMGGTIERKIRDQAKLMTNEESILKYIQLIRNTMWPNDILLRERPVRSAKERKKSRMEASVMLATLIPDMSASVVGRANAQAASRRLFAMYNNPRLNCHVVFKILDVLVEVLFPELGYTP